MPKTNYHLYLKGFVGGADFNRDHVYNVLKENASKPVNVLIDSLGGSVATALSIASAFRNHGDVTVHFVGMNASAATIASLGAKHISMDANAMYLVHKCSTEFFEWANMNADNFAELISDCEKIKEDLEKLDLNIASMYAAKCKKPTADLLALMQRGGWLTSQEARDWGFIDEITDLPEETAPVLTDAVASAMAAEGMPIPNVQIMQSQNLIERIFAQIASIFKTSNSDYKMETEKTDSLNARIAELEATLGERDSLIAEQTAKIGELTAALEEMKKKPAEATTQVLDTEAEDTTDRFALFAKTTCEARELFNSIP